MMARLVRIQFAGELVAWFLGEGHEVRATMVQNGLPIGARYVRCFDEAGNSLSLVFEHESFPEIESGGTIPILCPVFRDVRI